MQQLFQLSADTNEAGDLSYLNYDIYLPMHKLFIIKLKYG